MFLLREDQFRRSAQTGDEVACANGCSDNPSNVRPHRMHQQEVTFVVLGTNHLRDPRRHRHCRDTSRTDQRIDRVLWRQFVHQLGQQHTASGEPMLLENVDSLVLCQGHQSVDDLGQQLKGLVPFQRIGDCLAPRTVEEAAKR